MCVILRKSYGGAYIVMDSKQMGNDMCFAWPSAELAVMGAGQAAAILRRRATPEERAGFEADCAGAAAQSLISPRTAGTWTRSSTPQRPAAAVAAAFDGLDNKREFATAAQARQ